MEWHVVTFLHQEEPSLGAKDAEPAVALRCGCRRVVGHRRKTQPPTHHTVQYSAVNQPGQTEKQLIDVLQRCIHFYLQMK